LSKETRCFWRSPNSHGGAARVDVLAILRTMGALALLLGLLGGALWAVRRFNLRLPGAVSRHSTRRLELVERLSIDQRRSAVLIRRDDREHLLIVSPEGQVIVETYPCRDDRNAPASYPVEDNPSEKGAPHAFTALLDKALSKRGGGPRPSMARVRDRMH